MSVNSTSPAEIFGGTWEQVKGRFLLGVGANEENNSWAFGSINAGVVNCPVKEKGGEAQHQLTVNEMPSHNYVQYIGDGSTNQIANPWRKYLTNGTQSGGCYRNSSWQSSGLGDYITTANSGNSVVHNNMPPYFAVYIWYRTS